MQREAESEMALDMGVGKARGEWVLGKEGECKTGFLFVAYCEHMQHVEVLAFPPLDMSS